MMYIYNFMAFKVLNKILFIQSKTFVCFFFVTPHSRIFSPFIYTESGMEEERQRERETSIERDTSIGFSRMDPDPELGSSLQLKYVPLTGIEPATLQSMGQFSIHGAKLARAKIKL